MLSHREVQQVERSLANAAQDTRDEIGFLLIHQGFADRFFPGTSVLHTRVRYALFVPWLYQRAASSRRRGSTVDTVIRQLFIELAVRLKSIGGEPYHVIGGDKLGQVTSQPPDRVYWTALRTWGLLLPTIHSRAEALRRLQAAARPTMLDDDGARLDDVLTEVFVGLPERPAGWDEAQAPLRFKLLPHEREFLCRRLSQVTRPGDTRPSLLANLVSRGDTFPNAATNLPEELISAADDADKSALRIARDAASLAAIGRAVYGALVEQLRARDGEINSRMFSSLLETHFDSHGEAASRCDMKLLEALLPSIPAHVQSVLGETQQFIRRGRPSAFSGLLECYRTAEVIRKGSRRARLVDTDYGAHRRAEWSPARHDTSPLHYRWHIVRNMLSDLSGSA